MSPESPWHGFRFIRDVVPSETGNEVHLHNLTIAQLLFDARNAYVEAAGILWASLFATDRNMVMRRLEIDFESESPAGIPLKVGVRATTRSRRTLIFEEALWRIEPPHAIAVARSVHVVIRLSAPGAISLPDDLVEKFENYEGRPLCGPTT